jgi:hypothetical protein
VTSATHFLRDIIRQRTEMPRALEYLMGDGKEPLRQAGDLISNASAVFLTGLGASWNAAVCAGSLFHQNGRPVYMQEAGDLLNFTCLPAAQSLLPSQGQDGVSRLLSCLPKQSPPGLVWLGSRTARTVRWRGKHKWRWWCPPYWITQSPSIPIRRS